VDVKAENIFSLKADSFDKELFETIIESSNFRIERIVSTGQATPADQWYDQEQDEWVLLLSGSAGLVFHGDTEICVMKSGDYVHIPAHKRHRVEWTDSEQKTVWLAFHYKEMEEPEKVKVS
jgi:cupin 2 domain-containing protein